MFDNDGLLLDTEQAWTRAETDLFERYGLAFGPEHKRDLLGSSGAQAAAELERMLGQPGRGGELLAELDELVMEELLAGVPPRPGALELLRAVRSAGVPVGLASNSSRPFVERALDVAGLANGHFDTVVTADDVSVAQARAGRLPGRLRRPRGAAGARRGARGLAPGRRLSPRRGDVRDRRPVLPRNAAGGRLARGALARRPERRRGPGRGRLIAPSHQPRSQRA